MERQLKLEDDNILDIKITNASDKPVHTISLNMADTELPKRVAVMLQNIEALSDDAEKDEAEFNKNFANAGDLEKTIESSRIRVNYIHKMIDEIEIVFGQGTIDGVFAEQIALDEDFLPDEYALMDFLEKFVPIINDVFGTRIKVNNKKYSVNRRGKGKHNLTKEELIQRQMGK